MLKQVVGVVASVVAITVVGLALAVLVRLSWSPQTSYPGSSSQPATPGSDKVLRKA